MEKCYNVMVTDGSVKMVCCGDSGEISNFLKEIQLRGEQKGALIEDIRKEEIPYHIYLPQRFIRLYTDELEDTNRKLDVGIEILRNIKSDTSAIKVGIDTLNMKFDSFIHGQEEHNLRLEKILEKLAEK